MKHLRKGLDFGDFVMAGMALPIFFVFMLAWTVFPEATHLLWVALGAAAYVLFVIGDWPQWVSGFAKWATTHFGRNVRARSA